MKICKNQAVIIFTAVFSTIVIISSIFWDYMWQDEFLGKWASLITILSVIGIPLAYFSNQNKKENEKKQKEIDERTRASENLHGELGDALDALDAVKYKDDFWTLEFGDKEVQYMNRSLNHDIYDSLIFSGKINFLRHNLQQKIQDIFKRIKVHNDYITKIREMEDKKDNEDKTYDYYKRLEDIEKILLTDVPIAMKKLNEDTQ